MSDAAARSPRVRVVVAKLGDDDHDRGAQVLARALRDAGLEVIYTGVRQSPEQVVATVVQEDAVAVGLSVLSGDHRALFASVLGLLAQADAADVVVFGGGVIPAVDLPGLEAAGVRKIFTPGSSTATIVDWARETFGGGSAP
jgi:methylmalonyl-CoA mutase C-terminal domain/subunit